MGSENSRGGQSSKNLDHPILKELKYPSNARSNNQMVVEVPIDEVQYKEWASELKKNQNKIKEKQLLLLPKSHSYSNSGLCSKTGIAKIAYDDYPYLLQDQIRLVKSKQSTFSEVEIWKLLNDMVEAKKQFWDLSKDSTNNLGDIHPRNIFLNREGNLRVANHLSWPNFQSSYKRGVLREMDSSYHSPEDLELLEIGALQNLPNPNSEICSLGMALLSVGLTENIDHVSDPLSLSTNMAENRNKNIEPYLSSWKSTLYYSQILRALVYNMVEADSSSRLSFEEIDAFLKPHQKSINAHQPLTIKNAPKKLHNQVRKLRAQQPSSIDRRFDQVQSERLQKLEQRNLSYSLDQNQSNGYRNPHMTNTTVYNGGRATMVSPKPSLNQQSIFPYTKDPVKELNLVEFSKTALQKETSGGLQSSQKKKPDSPVNTLYKAESQENGLSFEHQQQLNMVATRLIDQSNGSVKRTESLVEPNELQSKGNPRQMKASFLANDNYHYHTYVEQRICSSFQEAWPQFINMIRNPHFYFPQYSDLIKVKAEPDSREIEIPPGHVKLETNEDEGKIHLMNLSQTCTGDILGGVNRRSSNQVQVWFNSSYTYKDQPFPDHKMFTKYLQKLKDILES